MQYILRFSSTKQLNKFYKVYEENNVINVNSIGECNRSISRVIAMKFSSILLASVSSNQHRFTVRNASSVGKLV